MISEAHRGLETPEHRLRLLAVVTALGLVAATAGGVAAIAGARGALSPQLMIVAGAVSALGMFALGAAALPLARWLLGDRSRHQLIVAASPLHPLLKRLMVEAPGTYVHSLAAANLSEAAAEAIGADPLVARVGAYYHDVGKLARPCYFFENAENGENPHEHRVPVDSASIITAHVNDGLVLAQHYRLPAPIADIISQHHGTSVVRFFYHKAAQTDAGVFESDYRYHGVRPHSREAAIVMLADASEASIRAMAHPDSVAIEKSVRAVVAERRADGQLEESGLTEEDIESIVNTFVRNLVHFRHVRCEYPQETRGEDAHADQRP